MPPDTTLPPFPVTPLPPTPPGASSEYLVFLHSMQQFTGQLAAMNATMQAQTQVLSRMQAENARLSDALELNTRALEKTNGRLDVKEKDCAEHQKQIAGLYAEMYGSAPETAETGLKYRVLNYARTQEAHSARVAAIETTLATVDLPRIAADAAALRALRANGTKLIWRGLGLAALIFVAWNWSLFIGVLRHVWPGNMPLPSLPPAGP